MNQLIYIVVTVLLLATGCKSEFERIRTSGDPEMLLSKANAYYDDEQYLRAQTLYELAIPTFRGRKEAELISFRYAYTYYNMGSFLLASYYFKNFAQTFGASQYREEADFMAAYSNYELSPVYRLDQSYTEKAIEAFQEFVNQYPNSDRVNLVNNLIDEMRAKLEVKAYEAAKLYTDVGQYQSAIQSFDNLLKDFPDTDNAEEVRYLIVRSAYELASNSFVEYQRERYEVVLERGETYLQRYTNGEYSREVRNYVENSEKRLKQLEDVRYQSTSARN